MFMFNRRLRLVCIGVAIAVSIATRAFAADEKAKPATLSADQSSKSGIDVQSVVLRLLEEAEVPANTGMWRDTEEHATENIGSTALRVLFFEPK